MLKARNDYFQKVFCFRKYARFEKRLCYSRAVLELIGRRPRALDKLRYRLLISDKLSFRNAIMPPCTLILVSICDAINVKTNGGWCIEIMLQCPSYAQVNVFTRFRSMSSLE